MAAILQTICWNCANNCLRQMSGLAKESAQELPGYSLHMRIRARIILTRFRAEPVVL